MTTIKIIIEKDNSWDCEGSPRENLSATFKTDGSQENAEKIASSIACLLAGFESLPIKATYFGDPALTPNQEQLKSRENYYRSKIKDSEKFQQGIWSFFSNSDQCTISKQDIYDLLLKTSLSGEAPVK